MVLTHNIPCIASIVWKIIIHRAANALYRLSLIGMFSPSEKEDVMSERTKEQTADVESRIAKLERANKAWRFVPWR